ncbi:MAG: chloride channel protein [Alphaproteobacteria bacterium]|nr:chloride channel protein [Alphaproteobacteria bacterium]
MVAGKPKPKTSRPGAVRRRVLSRRSLVRLRGVVRRLRRTERLFPLVMAITIGVVAGYASLAFRWTFGLIQTLTLQVSGERIYAQADALAWWHLLLVTTLGGLAVGLFIRFVMPDRRPLGVADVMEASALRGGRMSLPAGVGAAVASAASIGVGASVGREGPVVHLGATLAAWVAARFRLGRAQQQTLLGCGVAAAIAASFNAPIAGVLFALEVVVGHYALSAFAPVVIASVISTLISHAYFGAFPAFIAPAHNVVELWEFPAFALLGVTSAIAAILFMRSIMFTAKVAERLPVPDWSRPAVGGLAVGLIALAFPQVLGVGYGATSDALDGLFPLYLLLALIVAKTAATAISLGFGFGGGVFSPSLVVGAMLGGAFGIIATQVFPDHSSGQGAYSLIGMGAVAGSVLGAPISTILIMFELTRDYALTVAVMVAVVVASLITQSFHGRSFFVWQLERRGLNLKGGREAGLLRAVRLRDIMDNAFDSIAPDASLEEVRRCLISSTNGELFVTAEDGRLEGAITFAEIGEAAFDESADQGRTALDIARRNPPFLQAGDDLDSVMRRIGGIGEPHVAVVADKDSMVMVGLVHEREIMLAYQRAIAQARAEERGEA